VRPSEEHIRLAVHAAVVLMAPVVRWLLRHGVSYGTFADSLKAVFVNVARQELERGGSKTTDSALSVLSGVHRKDVRALTEVHEQRQADGKDILRNVPLASQVFTRWLTDVAYRDRAGAARPLPRVGPRRSFEALCTSISTDVHPRTVLEELIRLGLVRLEEDVVVPLAAAFIPSRKLDDLTNLFAANVADHVAAGAHNLTMPGAKYLEQSVWADGLSMGSVEQLHRTSREAWDHAFQAVVAQARDRVEADADSAENQRIRFGVYFFSEPVEADLHPPPTRRLPEPRTARKTRSLPPRSDAKTRRTP